MKRKMKNPMKFKVTFVYQADMTDEDDGKPDSRLSALKLERDGWPERLRDYFNEQGGELPPDKLLSCNVQSVK